MLDYARRAGWAVRPDALVSPYTFKTPKPPGPTTASKNVFARTSVPA